jgi:hypothetical protein
MRRLCSFPLIFLAKTSLRLDPLLQFEDVLLVMQSCIFKLDLGEHKLFLELQVFMLETSVFLHERLHLLQHLVPLALGGRVEGAG